MWNIHSGAFCSFREAYYFSLDRLLSVWRLVVVFSLPGGEDELLLSLSLLMNKSRDDVNSYFINWRGNIIRILLLNKYNRWAKDETRVPRCPAILNPQFFTNKTHKKVVSPKKITHFLTRLETAPWKRKSPLRMKSDCQLFLTSSF